MTDTVVGALAEVASRGRGALVFHERDGSRERLRAADLLEEGRLLAGALVSRGVVRGDAVGLLGPNHSAWARWAFRIWTGGAAVAPIQFPLPVRDPASPPEQ